MAISSAGETRADNHTRLNEYNFGTTTPSSASMSNGLQVSISDSDSTYIPKVTTDFTQSTIPDHIQVFRDPRTRIEQDFHTPENTMKKFKSILYRWFDLSSMNSLSKSEQDSMNTFLIQEIYNTIRTKDIEELLKTYAKVMTPTFAIYKICEVLAKTLQRYDIGDAIALSQEQEHNTYGSTMIEFKCILSEVFAKLDKEEQTHMRYLVHEKFEQDIYRNMLTMDIVELLEIYAEETSPDLAMKKILHTLSKDLERNDIVDDMLKEIKELQQVNHFTQSAMSVHMQAPILDTKYEINLFNDIINIHVKPKLTATERYKFIQLSDYSFKSKDSNPADCTVQDILICVDDMLQRKGFKQAIIMVKEILANDLLARHDLIKNIEQDCYKAKNKMREFKGILHGLFSSLSKYEQTRIGHILRDTCRQEISNSQEKSKTVLTKDIVELLETYAEEISPDLAMQKILDTLSKDIERNDIVDDILDEEIKELQVYKPEVHFL